jgi:hypothetical protein
VLDRPNLKRCELLVQKPRREGGTYEQVFFGTESGIRPHRSRTQLRPGPEVPPDRPGLAARVPDGH